MNRIRHSILVCLFALALLPGILSAEELVPKGRVIFLVSFSMPDESLQQWMEAGQRMHAEVAVRGLVQNSFRKTSERLSAIFHRQSSKARMGLQLDPVIFKRFGVKRVPAVVVENGSSFDVAFGNTSAQFLLQKIADRGDALSPVARDALKYIRKF